MFANMAASTSDSCSTSACVSTDVSTAFDSDLDSEEEVQQEETRVVSLLDRLKSPTTADVSRQRKTMKNVYTSSWEATV